MLETFHIRIKKDYATAIIKDLEKMDAVELLYENSIPEWHMQVVTERLNEYKSNPSLALDFDTAIDEIENEI